MIIELVGSQHVVVCNVNTSHHANLSKTSKHWGSCLTHCKYTYLAGPKKNVILMGNRAFDHFLASIQAKIGNLNNTITILEKCAVSYKRKVDAVMPKWQETWWPLKMT